MASTRRQFYENSFPSDKTRLFKVSVADSSLRAEPPKSQLP